ncbi:MAG: AAA family ATPase [Gemmatimonadota bacterium]|jgi:pilus assembly protein CpaE
MINCALISADDGFRRQVLDLIRKPDSGARSVLEIPMNATDLSRERVAYILSADPHVAFIDLGTSLTGLRVLDVLSQEAPEVAMIAAGPSLPADVLLKVIRAGASEYLPRPITVEETTEAFQRVRRRLGGRVQDDPSQRGRVTSVFSPKGGVGVTTVAVNLAVGLRQMTEKPTLLVDLAPSLGTAALSMGLHPRYSYLDVIQNFHRIDEQLFRSFLEAHASGVEVLASPPRTDDQNGPSMDEVMGVLRLCRRHFGQIVVDAGHSLTSAADTALMEADQRIFVTTPELPTLRNLKRALEMVLEHSTNGKAPPRLVLNQYKDGVGVSVHDVESGLGLAVDTVIGREDSLATESINLGRPALLMGRSKFARSINQLAEEVAGSDKVASSEEGLLATFLRPFRSSATKTPSGEMN